MKKIILSIALFSALCCNAQPYSKETVKVITDSFIATLLYEEDIKATLRFFDKAYVAEEHDDFLEGRTEQFVSEFLAGSFKKGYYFVNPKLNEILTIKVKKCVYNIKKGEIYSIVEITLDTGVRYKVKLDMTISETGTLGFIGAVG